MSISEFNIRPVTELDSRQLWKWRNTPADRAHSFSTKPISWETHLDWFSNKLADPACYLFIIELQGRSVGQLRVEIDDDASGEVHIFVDQQFRGQGLAKEALALSKLALKKNVRVTTLVARVKPDNVSSAILFLKSGFHFVRCIQHMGVLCYEMKINCP